MTASTDKATATVRYSEIKEGQATTTTTITTENGNNSTSLLNRALFLWFDKFVLLGQNRGLNSKALWNLDSDFRAYNITDQWKYHEKYQKPSFKTHKFTLSLILKLCKNHILVSGVLEAFRIVFLIMGPQVLRHLLNALESASTSNWHGFEYCIFLVSVGFLGSFCETHTYFQLNNAGIKMKTALISAIYRKSLKMIQPIESDIMNLISVDCPNLQKAFRFIHFPWSCPLQICISLYYLYDILHNAMIPGMVILVFIMLISVTLTVSMKRFQSEQLSRKDSRLNKIIEAVSNLKLIKLHAWEDTFKAKVEDARISELASIRKFLTLQALQNFIWNCAVFLVAFVSFASYSSSQEGRFSAQAAFVSLAVLNTMRSTFRLMPTCVSAFIQAFISIERIDRFLQNESGIFPISEHHSNASNGNNASNGAISAEEYSKRYSVFLKNCCFARNPKLPEGLTPTTKNTSLTNISIAIQRGEFVGIVGGMASGKSTLISALSGEIRKTKGVFHMFDKMIHVPNNPWLKSGTIRDNILFGCGSLQHGHRSKLYEKVIRECGLLEDLQRLPDGDLTWVKKNGENLSGGQRQRISLARSVFKNAGIYFFDDPMSAIDPCLRSRIFDQVIGNKGLLRKKTRIIITKDQRFLQKLDYIIVMKNQTIFDSGTLEELTQRQSITAEAIYGDEDDAEMIEASEVESPSQNSIPECDAGSDRRSRVVRRQSVLQYIQDQHSFDDDPMATLYKMSNKRASLKRTSSINAASPMMANSHKDTSVFDQIDDMPYEKVSPEVYGYYLRALGIFNICVALVFYFGYQAFEIASKLWLSTWASSRGENRTVDGSSQSSTDYYYISVYGILGLLQSITYVAGILIMNMRTLHASLNLHKSIFHRVIHSTIDFIWTTPVGQIANRFSKDMDEIDVSLPNTVKNFINQLLRIMGTLIIVTYTFPSIIFTIIPLTFGVMWTLKSYIVTSRVLRRSAAATMAIVNAQMSETILGVATIRTYKLQTPMTDECMKAIDDHQTYYYMEMVSDCWLFLRLQLLTSIFIGVLSFVTVIYKDSMGVNMAGLSLTSAITVLQDVFLFARYSAALEKAMVSVERVKEYEDIIQETVKLFVTPEPDETIIIDDNMRGCPQGMIEFKNVTARYPLRCEIILKNLTFDIYPGQHIAVVGRTGSGKSSLILSVFRMLETLEGSISIDGQDVTKLPLAVHRSRLTIIPQEMALFSGTLRFNLDPMEKHSDDHIWECIRTARMNDYIERMPNGLETIIETDGVGLSNGEKQVIACIRGLLGDSKIVILDEATSHLGARLDDKMDRAFRSRFKDSTVMIITHNMEKTLSCDKIMVMDGGKLKEFDTPQNLLSGKNSLYYVMAKDSGLVE